MNPCGYQLMQGFAHEGACGASVPKAISLACVAWWFKSQCLARTSTLKHQVLVEGLHCTLNTFIIEYVFGQSLKYIH